LWPDRASAGDVEEGTLFRAGMPRQKPGLESSRMQKLGVANLEPGANRVLNSRKTLHLWNKRESVWNKRELL